MPMVVQGDQLLLTGVLVANDPRGEIFEGDAITFNPDGGVRAAVSGDRVIGQCSQRAPNTEPIGLCLAGPAQFIADGSIAAGKGLVPSNVPGRVRQAGNSPQDRAAICGVGSVSASDGAAFNGFRV